MSTGPKSSSVASSRQSRTELALLISLQEPVYWFFTGSFTGDLCGHLCCLSSTLYCWGELTGICNSPTPQYPNPGYSPVWFVVTSFGSRSLSPLSYWPWCADVAPASVDKVLYDLPNLQLVPLRHISHNGCIFWELLQVTVCSIASEVWHVEGEEEAGEHCALGCAWCPHRAGWPCRWAV